ncbi:MAG: flotillin family protein, partial [Actinomycetota bacterium]|nr:flotillin family protein [Actinomycetota bacterium]
ALAEAEAIEGAKQGEAEKARRLAIAEATQREGEAQAAALAATGAAEAAAMEQKAEAFANYNDAAVLQMLVGILPELAKQISAPMAAIDNLTVVSTDGASQLPRQVTSNLVETMEMLRATTGLDLQQLMQKVANRDGRRAPGAPAVRPAVDGDGGRS